MSDKILIIKHGSLGDMVSATSVFKSIRNHFYQNKIYLLTPGSGSKSLKIGSRSKKSKFSQKMQQIINRPWGYPTF